MIRTGLFALAATGALIGATALPGQAATTPGWRAAQTYPAMSGLTGVSATAANDAFAVGDQANADGTPSSKPDIISRWDGSTWLTLPQPPAVKNYAPTGGGAVVAASSKSNAWLFVQASRTNSADDYTLAQLWNGSKWVSQSVFPAWDLITNAVTSSPTNAWVFGQNISGGPTTAYAAHWNGKTWTKASFSLIAQDVSALSGSDIWAIGQQQNSDKFFVTEHYYKGAWHTLPTPSIAVPKGDGYQATNIVAESDTNVWAAAFLTRGQGVTAGIVLEHYNGRSWTRVTVPYSVTAPFTLAADGSGGIWLSATEFTKTSFASYFYHYTGGKWVARIEIPHGKDIQISPAVTTWIPGTKSLWSVGEEWSTATTSTTEVQGLILKYGA
jgi:hypothetical protein